MSVQSSERRDLAHEMCRYPGSKLTFRGPERSLRQEFIACLGSTETFGRFVSHPFPDLLETSLGQPCVNLGWPNAGVDVLLRDEGLLDVAQRAQLVVLQVPCAVNMSNRFYRVHPRRNDRFLQANEPLRQLFPEVDFTDFTFTRHLLENLRSVSSERFVQVHAELARCWISGMTSFLEKLHRPVVLFWFSNRSPEQHSNDPGVQFEPALVTPKMLVAVRPLIHDLVLYNTSRSARADRVDVRQDDLALSEDDVQMARELPGPRAHKKAAAALLPSVKAALEDSAM